MLHLIENLLAKQILFSERDSSLPSRVVHKISIDLIELYEYIFADPVRT